MKLAKVLPLALFSLLAMSAQTASAFESYTSLMGTYVLPDDKRGNADYGAGGHLVFGLPLTEGLDLELNGFGYQLKPKTSGDKDPAFGGGLDIHYSLADSHTFGLFFLLGVGAIHEEVGTDKGTSPYADGGFSLNFWNLLGIHNLSARGDARYYYINRNNSNFSNSALKQDDIGDGHFNLGLQYDFAGPKPKKALELRDTDGDGVIDTQDQCPNTPPATEVDDRGCPVVQDSDGDGVNDPDDRCPNTPPGSVVDTFGCPPPPPMAPPVPLPLPVDTDGDGVVDSLDQCPNTHAGLQVDARGCPINNDIDADGVPNAIDQCPNTPHGMRVDATGCVVKQVVVLHNINFQLGSDQLVAEAKDNLDAIANGLRGQPGMVVEISGHTDSLGSQQYNLTLSQKRAKSVKSYLMSKGIAPTRMTTEGFGENDPISSNDTESGRAKNRRVEFKILHQ